MKKLLLMIALFLQCFIATAQDLNFSQFYELPLLRNPALAGVFNGDLRVKASHRNQWQSVTVPFQTSALSVEYKLPIFNEEDYVTVGTQIVNDVAGDIKLKRTQLMPVVNYHKAMSYDKDNYLSVSFMGGLVSTQFDPSQARLGDQFQNGAYNPSNPSQQQFPTSALTYLDVSTGLVYSSGFGEYSTFYVGGAVFHATQPKMKFNNGSITSRLQRKYTANVGISTSTDDLNRLIAFGDYMSQGGNKQLLIGALYERDVIDSYVGDENVSIAVGSFYRWRDAVIPVVRLSYYQWTVGMSYDVNVSTLKTASQMRGGFEITATWRGFLNTSSSTLDRMKCVKF